MPTVLKEFSNNMFLTAEKKGHDTHYYVRTQMSPTNSIRIAEICQHKNDGSIKDIFFMMEEDMLADILKGSGFTNADDLATRIRQCSIYLPKPCDQATVALEASSIMV